MNCTEKKLTVNGNDKYKKTRMFGCRAQNEQDACILTSRHNK